MLPSVTQGVALGWIIGCPFGANTEIHCIEPIQTSIIPKHTARQSQHCVFYKSAATRLETTFFRDAPLDV
jgi:hypothetical protein